MRPESGRRMRAKNSGRTGQRLLSAVLTLVLPATGTAPAAFAQSASRPPSGAPVRASAEPPASIREDLRLAARIAYESSSIRLTLATPSLTILSESMGLYAPRLRRADSLLARLEAALRRKASHAASAASGPKRAMSWARRMRRLIRDIAAAPRQPWPETADAAIEGLRRAEALLSRGQALRREAVDPSGSLRRPWPASIRVLLREVRAQLGVPAWDLLPLSRRRDAARLQGLTQARLKALAGVAADARKAGDSAADTLDRACRHLAAALAALRQGNRGNGEAKLRGLVIAARHYLLALRESDRGYAASSKGSRPALPQGGPDGEPGTTRPGDASADSASPGSDPAANPQADEPMAGAGSEPGKGGGPADNGTGAAGGSGNGSGKPSGKESESKARAYATKMMAQLRKVSCLLPELNLSSAPDIRQAWRETSKGFSDIARRAGYANPKMYLAELLKRADQGECLKPQPDPAAADIWSRAGVFVWQAADYGRPEDFARMLQANRFGWAAVAIHDPINDPFLRDGWVDRLKAAGIRVGAWAYVGEDPEGDAQRFSKILSERRFDFFIVDAEAEYKTDTGGDFGRSARFVRAFRALQPTLPSALSSYGWLGDYSRMGTEEEKKMNVFDFNAWKTHGFRWLPQIYWNEFETYEPANAVAWAVAKGWPRDWVHPTIGLYGARKHGAAEYVQRLRETGTVGFSVYLANQMTAEEYRVLGQAVGPAGIAR